MVSTGCAATILGCFLVALGGHAAQAADDKVVLPIADALAAPQAKAKLDGSVAFYFGNTAHPAVLKSFGNFTTNKKSNAFGKSDAETCNWVLLSALITLQERAQNEGGDAVINIKSYYKKNEVSYDKEFECHVGTFVSGVTLKGDVVKLKR
jgi:hypothetical protein